MDDAAIGWGGLALSLILVGVAVGLSLWQGLRLEKDMLWATGRALVQLLAVGYVLLYIVDPDTPVAFAWAWVVLMLGVSALTARRRAPEVPGIAGLTLAATSGSALLSLFVVFGLGVYPVAGRAIVPIAGMMIGNSIGSIVVASHRILGELADRRPEVEARLALGQPWQQASKPFVRSRAAHRPDLADREHEGRGVGVPPGGDDRAHPRRRRSRRCRPGAGGDHVPDPRLRGDQRRDHRTRPHPTAVHPRPPARPARRTGG